MHHKFCIALSLLCLSACASSAKTAHAPAPTYDVRPVIESSQDDFDISGTYKKATQNYKTEKFEQSFEGFQSITLRNPNHIEAQIGLGSTAIALGLGDIAYNIFSKTIPAIKETQDHRLLADNMSSADDNNTPPKEDASKDTSQDDLATSDLKTEDDPVVPIATTASKTAASMSSTSNPIHTHSIKAYIADNLLSDVLQAHKTTIFNGLVLAEILAGKSQDIEVRLNQALEHDRSDPRLWNALGQFHDGQAAWSAAQDAYIRALKTGKAASAVINNLGMSLLMQGRYDEAAAKFTQAITIKPSSKLYDNNQRLLMILQGDYAKALRGLGETRAAHILNDAGYIAMQKEDYTLAETLFERAIETNPTYHDKAYANLAVLKEKDLWDKPAATYKN